MNDEKKMHYENREKPDWRNNKGIFICLFAIVCLLILGGILLKNSKNDNNDQFSEIACYYNDYDKLDDTLLVPIVETGKEENDVCALIGINKKTKKGSMSAFLEPGTYQASNALENGFMEFEIKDASEEYVMEIDCTDGSMELKEYNLAHIKCNHVNSDNPEKEESVYIRSREIDNG